MTDTKLSDQDQAAAEALVIPEYERDLREAHAAGDTARIESVSKEYTDERVKRFKQADKK